MRVFGYFMLISVCICACKPLLAPDPNAQYLILHHAQVIDPEKGSIEAVEMIVIKDSLIEYVGDRLPASQIPPGEEMDLNNAFLSPPFWDMHFHLSWDFGNDSLLSPLLLSKGIQGIRDMGGDLSVLQAIKDKAHESPSKSIQVFGAGPILDGNPPVMLDFTLALDSSIHIEEKLDSLWRNGADFFKTYSLLKETELQRIAAYSQENELSFQGHLSEYIDPEISLSLGQKSIEHLNRLDEIWQNDPDRLERIADLMIEKNTWLCPTLVIYQKKAWMNTPAIIHDEYEAYIHPILQQEWQQSKMRRLEGKTEQDWEQARQLFFQQKALVAFLHKKGVKILAGSDFAGMPYVYPGLGLLEELELLQTTGISDAEVLKIAVWNPLEFWDLTRNRGKIKPGFYANFLVLPDNPLKDIRVIYSIEQVFRHGQKL